MTTGGRDYFWCVGATGRKNKGSPLLWCIALSKRRITPKSYKKQGEQCCETGVTMTDSLPPLCPLLQTSPPLHGTTCHPLWTEQHKGGLEGLTFHPPAQPTGLRLYRTSPTGFPWCLSMYGPLERQKINKYSGIIYTAKEKGKQYLHSQPNKRGKNWSNTRWDLRWNVEGKRYVHFWPDAV